MKRPGLNSLYLECHHALDILYPSDNAVGGSFVAIVDIKLMVDKSGDVLRETVDVN